MGNDDRLRAGHDGFRGTGIRGEGSEGRHGGECEEVTGAAHGRVLSRVRVPGNPKPGDAALQSTARRGTDAAMMRLLLLLPLLLCAACSAPGFPPRKSGDPPRTEITVEASHTH